jgi:hypothetical protein
MPMGVRRWITVLLLPLLVGGLLLMHGLAASGGGDHHGGVAAELHAAGVSAEHHDVHDHAHCPECIAGHLVAACVAVVAVVVSLRVACRVLILVRAGAVDRPSETASIGVVRIWRPPDPAWVRLSVMRC